jgi:uncharacterized protein YeaO (DUF488 family)
MARKTRMNRVVKSVPSVSSVGQELVQGAKILKTGNSKNLRDLCAEQQTVTLVYGAQDERHNQAVVLKKIVEGLKSK